VQEGEQLFEAALPISDVQPVLFGSTQALTEQPEFSAADRLRRLLELTETPHALGETMRKRVHAPGISITIGAEHDDPRLEDFTVVTAEYHIGPLAGVIGVIGPTRMPYDKVIALVSHTSRLLSDLLE
jgi:heat-inducible transcriptional repressor